MSRFKQTNGSTQNLYIPLLLHSIIIAYPHLRKHPVLIPNSIELTPLITCAHFYLALQSESLQPSFFVLYVHKCTPLPRKKRAPQLLHFPLSNQEATLIIPLFDLPLVVKFR